MISLTKNKVIAVIGASANQEKYGYKILNTLKVKGVKVYPVNPKANCIGGLRVWPDLKSLPERPDIISIVVPPAVSLQIVEQAKELNYDHLWFQPGSFDDRAKELHLNYENQACILIAASQL